MGMPAGGERLLSIGEFSRLSRISIRMLRHYDERGVLRPSSTDARSGYRRYAPELLETARWIRRLRDLGLGVSELSACSGLFGDVDAMRTVLDRQRQRLLAEAETVTSRLGQIDRIVTELEESGIPIEIALRTMPQRTVASLRDRIETYTEEGSLWQRLMAALPAAGIRVAAMPQAVAVFHDEGYVESGPDVEVQLDVAEPFTGSGGSGAGSGAGTGEPLCCVTTPERDVACGTLRGGYAGVGTVLEALGRWTCSQGYQFAGQMFNVYIVGPAQDPDPSNWITEVCVPVTPDRAGPI